MSIFSSRVEPKSSALNRYEPPLFASISAREGTSLSRTIDGASDKASTDKFGKQGIKTSYKRVSLLDCDALTPSLITEWRELANNAISPNPFFQPDMLAPTLREYGPKEHIRLLTVRCPDSGLLIGMLPVVTGHQYGKLPIKHYQTWRYKHFYNGTPLVKIGYESSFMDFIGEWIDSRPDNARFLRFKMLPADNSSALAFLHLRSGVHFELPIVRAFLSGGQDFNVLMERVYKGKKRKELRRQFRRLEENGPLSYETFGTFDTKSSSNETEIEIAIENFLTMEMSGWKGRDGDCLGDNDNRYIMTAALRSAFSAGNAMIVSLVQKRADDTETIASLLCLRHNEEACAYKTAYDENYASYSPGIHVLLEATKIILDRDDITRFDSCAKQDHNVADKIWPQRRKLIDLIIPASDFSTSLLMIIARTGAKFYRLLKVPFAYRKNDNS